MSAEFTTTPARTFPPPDQMLRDADTLITTAARIAADDAPLTWDDRDFIARALDCAARIVREVNKTSFSLVASCLECQSVELADAIMSDQCPTCAYSFAVSN